MSYAFGPPPNSLNRDYAFWQGGYTEEELDSLIEELETLPKQKGIAGDGSNDKIRDSHIAWVPFPQQDARFTWLYDRVADQIRRVNAEYFRFDLWGFIDNLQYTVYDASRGGQHYDWHIDALAAGGPVRKLSFSLLLSDPMDFEGGELWIHGLVRETLPKVRGLMHVFPSYTLHRVTPVTRGVRRSLVGWVSGPEFR